MKTIGIIGYGFVGKAVHAGFPKNTVLICDPLLPETATISDLVAKCDFIFVCVPTPMLGDGGPVDLDIISQVMRDLSTACTRQGRRPIIVIKSTVPATALIAYAELNLRLTMSPEYLRERDAVQAFLRAELLVVGAEDHEDGMQVVRLFFEESICNPCPYFVVDLPSAGIIKYMENTFLAMKVIFMNQWKAVHEATGSKIPWEKVVAAFHADSRCGRSHGQVPGPDGFHGYGGKCFPKDMAGAIHMADDLGVPLTLLKEVQAINDRIRESRDWLTIKGAVS